MRIFCSVSSIASSASSVRSGAYQSERVLSHTTRSLLRRWHCRVTSPGLGASARSDDRREFSHHSIRRLFEACWASCSGSDAYSAPKRPHNLYVSDEPARRKTHPKAASAIWQNATNGEVDVVDGARSWPRRLHSRPDAWLHPTLREMPRFLLHRGAVHKGELQYDVTVHESRRDRFGTLPCGAYWARLGLSAPASDM